MPISELQLEEDVLKKLEGQKFSRREDIRDRAALEANFRQKCFAVRRLLPDFECALRTLTELLGRRFQDLTGVYFPGSFDGR